ncbi:hypothetical protein V2595_07930 [Tenacibaculum maritimum]|uniref:LPD3 domain-containing protein n=1 Tax=Tenacibaculum maritimum TaxID=107401 RepID=UPI003875DA47
MLADFIEKYNGLNNNIVSRKTLNSLLKESNNYQCFTATAIKEKLSKLLEYNSDDTFHVKLKNLYSIPKKNKSSGLNAELNYIELIKKDLLKKKIDHTGIKETIRFSANGLGKIKQSKLKNQLLLKVYNLLKKSTLIDFTEQFKRKNKIAGIYQMNSTTKIEGVKYQIVLILKKGSNGVVYYDHKATKIEKFKAKNDSKGLKGADEEITLNIPKVEEIQIDLPIKKEIQILEPPIDLTKTVTTINKNINFVEPKKQSILQGNQPFQHEKTIVATKQKQKTPLLQQNKNPFKTSYELLNQEEKPTEYFKLHNQHLTTFLGKIEKKEKGSVVITLDSEEGGGKTHTAYQFANAFAEAGYKGVIFSFEEGANNSLSKLKQKKYFNEYTQQLISVAEDNSEFSKEQNYKMITDNIGYFDFIVVDSWAKILELNRKASLDNDFRKKYNGKVFLIINQRTKDGKMRGGANVAYDGDIILKGVVDREDFKNNYIYNHKNRYNDYNPISELKYSPYYQKLMTQEKEIVVNI